MPATVDLLQPIPGDNPSGVDLRYDPIYDKIKEARLQDDEAPQGDWARERKIADWPLVIKLATEALSKRTKDINLAVWLTEAMLRREGLPGLRSGLEVVRGLLEKFWDTLYPEIEDGDTELRAAPLNWMGAKLDTPVRQVPLVRAGYDFIRYDEAQKVGREADAGGEYNKLQARNALIERGMLTGEQWDKAFEETPKPFYKAVVADVDASLAALRGLDQFGDEKFGDAAPSYGRLKQALEDLQHLGHQLLKKKLLTDPDPVEETPAEPAYEVEVVSTGGAAAAAARAPVSAEPAGREDAIERVVAAARWLRRTERSNPASYLMLRGLRWGEVRMSPSRPDPRLLEAPSTGLRTQIKTLLLDGKWSELLEACETGMGQPCGRGWLDLQRYAVTASSRLGKDYYAVETALRDSLRGFLFDVPAILEMTMMDDTPTANTETKRWLAQEIGFAGAAAPATAEDPGAADEGAEARELARAGRTEEAVALLTRQLERERSARGRFRRRTQLASLLVDARQEAIALPILEELSTQIETYKLEEWESADVVSEPLALLYHCLQKTEGDSGTRQNLYLRICRLDPLRALSCPP